MAVTEPSLNPQDAADEVAVNDGPVKFKTMTGKVFTQRFTSFA